MTGRERRMSYFPSLSMATLNFARLKGATLVNPKESDIIDIKMDHTHSTSCSSQGVSGFQLSRSGGWCRRATDLMGTQREKICVGLRVKLPCVSEAQQLLRQESAVVVVDRLMYSLHYLPHLVVIK